MEANRGWRHWGSTSTRTPTPLLFIKSAKIKLASTCHLQTCYNTLKQLATSLWMTCFDNQLATSLSTTCNILVVITLSQAMRMHADIGSLIKLLLVVNRLVAICGLVCSGLAWD